RRRAFVQQPRRASARATDAHAAAAAAPDAESGGAVDLRLPLRRHSDRRLPGARRDPRTGGGVSELALIAALDRNHAIGRAGALPWHLPDDLKRFKQLTLGKPVLMGRKTAESIGRPLPGRLNLILTLSRMLPFHGADVAAVGSIDEALERADASDLMVIGG